jgi:hypothetical protein
MDLYDISPDRIVVLEQPVGADGKKKAKKYVGESKGLVDMFMNHYADLDWEYAFVMSDGGAAFKRGEVSAFEMYQCEKTYVFPSAIHQFLSPNDNKWHGVAKQKWRSDVKDHSDDVVSSLYLLYCLDEVSEEVMVAWWDKNFLWDMKKPSTEAVLTRLLGVKNGHWSDPTFYSSCLEEYTDFINGTTGRHQEVYAEPLKMVAGLLDGTYWNEYGH